MRRPLADLHVHTTASDGTLTPEQTVQEAALAELAAVGIADHDTVDGIEPALAAGHREGVIVVPAIEINTDWGKEEAHVLGYYIDHKSPPLKAHLDRLRSDRLDRARRFVERLNELGVKISLDRVKEIAGGGAIGRPHIARAIVEAGYVSSVNAAFGKYLVRGAPAYVERYKLTPIEAIGIVHGAGGAASLAHPGNSRLDDLIPQLVDAGLEGIEVYHTDHSAAQARHFLRMAQQYGLIATGGSDSHGPSMLKQVPVGHVTVDISIVHRLRAVAEERKAVDTSITPRPP